MLYTNFSDAERLDVLGMNVTTNLTNNDRGDFIESVVKITVLQNVSMNGTLVECRSEDLDSEMATVYVNTSGILLIILFQQSSELCFFTPQSPKYHLALTSVNSTIH